MSTIPSGNETCCILPEGIHRELVGFRHPRFDLAGCHRVWGILFFLSDRSDASHSPEVHRPTASRRYRLPSPLIEARDGQDKASLSVSGPVLIHLSA